MWSTEPAQNTALCLEPDPVLVSVRVTAVWRRAADTCHVPRAGRGDVARRVPGPARAIAHWALVTRARQRQVRGPVRQQRWLVA